MIVPLAPLRPFPESSYKGLLFSATEVLCCPTEFHVAPSPFSICLKLLGAVIGKLGMSCHQYADDTQISLSVPPASGNIIYLHPNPVYVGVSDLSH